MNGVQTRFKCKLDVKRCKRFVFPPSSLLPRSNALKTKAIRYFQTDQTLTRIVSSPLYKNFDLNIYFYGEAGRKRGASYYEGWTRMDNGINVSTYALKAFSSNNLTATDPTYVRGGNGWGDYYVKSIYYVRCGSITLGYKVPISQKIVNNLRVYVDVNNPFVITNWTGLDPETDNGTYAYPNVTSYNFGVSISF